MKQDFRYLKLLSIIQSLKVWVPESIVMDLTANAIQSILILSLIFKSPHILQVNRKLKDLDAKRSVDADEKLMKVIYIRTYHMQQVFWEIQRIPGNLRTTSRFLRRGAVVEVVLLVTVIPIFRVQRSGTTRHSFGGPSEGRRTRHYISNAWANGEKWRTDHVGCGLTAEFRLLLRIRDWQWTDWRRVLRIKES